MTNENGNGTKALDPEAIARSVIEQPPRPSASNPVPSYDVTSQVFWLLGQYADDITSWGKGYKQRDAQLRAFITQENIFASALGIICSRNSGFSWTLDGPFKTVARVQEILEENWHDRMVKTSIDLYTQDNGAFWEIVREERGNPASPVIAINHLDAARCWHTGNRFAPVIYMDRDANYHLLEWYEVIEFAEMPAAVEGLYGLQYCALTRLLRKAQTTRNMDIFDYEKTGGRNTRAIHMVKGITSQQLTDAINEAKAAADGQGLMRYMNPVVVGTLDPKADVGHDTIELTSMPSDYKPDEWFKQYINLIAMAFESDYQEFAPLPGGGLGTGAQSEMLHLKSRGKGPGTFMRLITNAINFRVLPAGGRVRFLFNEQDLEAEKSDAEVRNIRAQTRAIRIQSMEITPQVARQIAQDEGDLREEYLKMMAEDNLTPDTMVDDNSPADTQNRPVSTQQVINPPQQTQISSTQKPTPNAIRPK